MTVAGIEPKYDMRELYEHPFDYVPHGIGLYTEEQVREILIKQMGELLEYPFISTPEPEQYPELVDEFMNSEDK